MIIPSIDIKNGKVVQLVQGKRKILEETDYMSRAEYFSRFGQIALIDIDAACGSGNNENIIRDLLAIYNCRVGGGIRSVDKALRVLSYGAEKIIIGSAVFTEDMQINTVFLEKLHKIAGKEKIIIALDSYRGRIVINGWQKKTNLAVQEVLPLVEEYCDEVMITVVEREGRLSGIDLDQLELYAQHTSKAITCAGGVSSIEEISLLSERGFNIQLGMALYMGTVSLEGAFHASVKWHKGLVPVIVKDIYNTVLMLGYQNSEAWEETIKSGYLHFFSRSKNRLWKKGETSGNYQKFVRVTIDCDGDALMYTVAQENVACHTGSYSCFKDVKYDLNSLFDIIEERLSIKSAESYTASLCLKEIEEKLHEEKDELIHAGNKSEIIWEAADLLYFTLLYCAKRGVKLQEIYAELRRRRNNDTYKINQ